MRIFTIEAWGVRVGVDCEVSEFSDEARKLLLPVWTDSPDIITDEIFRISKNRNGQTRIEGPDDEGDILVAEAYIIETLERRLHMYLATHSRTAIYVHAGVVKWHERAIVIPGRSMTGKSTLVHALTHMGAAYLSDEFAIIDDQGLLHPFPRALSQRRVDGNERISAAHLNWDNNQSPLRESLVIVTKFKADARWNPSPLSPGLVTIEMFQNTVSAQKAPRHALSCLGAFARSSSGWRGDRGSAEDTATALLTL